MFKMGESLRFSIESMRVECGDYSDRKCFYNEADVPCRESLCPHRVVSKLDKSYDAIIKEIEKNVYTLYKIDGDQIKLIYESIKEDRGLNYNDKFILYIVYYLTVEYFNLHTINTPEFVYRIEYESPDDIYTTTHLVYGSHSQFPVFFDPGDFKHIVHVMSNVYGLNLLKIIHQL